MTPLNVLIVDDSLVTTQVLVETLFELGHNVLMTVKSGNEAISAYESCNPDVVTMDISMPGMNGIEATKEIMRSHPDARIVMVTAHAQQSMVVDAIKAGAKGYVLNPIKTDKLRYAIEQAVSRPNEPTSS